MEPGLSFAERARQNLELINKQRQSAYEFTPKQKQQQHNARTEYKKQINGNQVKIPKGAPTRVPIWQDYPGRGDLGQRQKFIPFYDYRDVRTLYESAEYVDATQLSSLDSWWNYYRDYARERSKFKDVHPLDTLPLSANVKRGKVRPHLSGVGRPRGKEFEPWASEYEREIIKEMRKNKVPVTEVDYQQYLQNPSTYQPIVPINPPNDFVKIHTDL